MSYFNTKCPFHVFVAGFLSFGALYAASKLPKLLMKSHADIVRHDVDKRFSNAITYNRTVYISGQVGEGSTIQDQTKAALDAVDIALAQAGTDKSKVLEVTVWLADIAADYAGMNAVYDEWLVPGIPPCRATVEAKLYSPKCRVEIRVIAAL